MALRNRELHATNDDDYIHLIDEKNLYHVLIIQTNKQPKKLKIPLEYVHWQ